MWICCMWWFPWWHYSVLLFFLISWSFICFLGRLINGGSKVWKFNRESLSLYIIPFTDVRIWITAGLFHSPVYVSLSLFKALCVKNVRSNFLSTRMNNCRLSNMQRLVFLDIAKAICIILVVIGHYHPENSPEWYNVIWKFIYSFHMPLFMFASGYE